MQFAYITPPPQIAHAVKALWIARGTREEFDHPDPIVPDGCVEIVLNLGDPFFEELDGYRVVQPRDLVAGQLTRPATARATGNVDLIGIRLLSSRAGMAFRTSMLQLQDRITALSGIWPDGATLVDDLRNTRRESRLSLLTATLAERFASVDPDRVRIVDQALTIVSGRRGAIAIDRVARACGVSRRHLERLFREHVGLTAKDFARITRVHAALDAVAAAPHLGGAEIAAHCGFSDQAHLIHECRAIAGVTPARFSAGTPSLSSLMREL